MSSKLGVDVPSTNSEGDDKSSESSDGFDDLLPFTSTEETFFIEDDTSGTPTHSGKSKDDAMLSSILIDRTKPKNKLKAVATSILALSRSSVKKKKPAADDGFKALEDQLNATTTLLQASVNSADSAALMETQKFDERRVTMAPFNVQDHVSKWIGAAGSEVGAPEATLLKNHLTASSESCNEFFACPVDGPFDPLEDGCPYGDAFRILEHIHDKVAQTGSPVRLSQAFDILLTAAIHRPESDALHLPERSLGVIRDVIEAHSAFPAHLALKFLISASAAHAMPMCRYVLGNCIEFSLETIESALVAIAEECLDNTLRDSDDWVEPALKLLDMMVNTTVKEDLVNLLLDLLTYTLTTNEATKKFLQQGGLNLCYRSLVTTEDLKAETASRILKVINPASLESSYGQKLELTEDDYTALFRSAMSALRRFSADTAANVSVAEEAILLIFSLLPKAMQLAKSLSVMGAVGFAMTNFCNPAISRYGLSALAAYAGQSGEDWTSLGHVKEALVGLCSATVTMSEDMKNTGSLFRSLYTLSPVEPSRTNIIEGGGVQYIVHAVEKATNVDYKRACLVILSKLCKSYRPGSQAIILASPNIFSLVAANLLSATPDISPYLLYLAKEIGKFVVSVEQPAVQRHPTFVSNKEKRGSDPLGTDPLACTVAVAELDDSRWHSVRRRQSSILLKSRCPTRRELQDLMLAIMSCAQKSMSECVTVAIAALALAHFSRLKGAFEVAEENSIVDFALSITRTQFSANTSPRRGEAPPTAETTAALQSYSFPVSAGVPPPPESPLLPPRRKNSIAQLIMGDKGESPALIAAGYLLAVLMNTGGDSVVKTVAQDGGGEALEAASITRDTNILCREERELCRKQFAVLAALAEAPAPNLLLPEAFRSGPRMSIAASDDMKDLSSKVTHTMDVLLAQAYNNNVAQIIEDARLIKNECANSEAAEWSRISEWHEEARGLLALVAAQRLQQRHQFEGLVDISRNVIIGMESDEYSAALQHRTSTLLKLVQATPRASSQAVSPICGNSRRFEDALQGPSARVSPSPAQSHNVAQTCVLEALLHLEPSMVLGLTFEEFAIDFDPIRELIDEWQNEQRTFLVRASHEEEELADAVVQRTKRKLHAMQNELEETQEEARSLANRLRAAQAQLQEARATLAQQPGGPTAATAGPPAAAPPPVAAPAAQFAQLASSLQGMHVDPSPSGQGTYPATLLTIMELVSQTHQNVIRLQQEHSYNKAGDTPGPSPEPPQQPQHNGATTAMWATRRLDLPAGPPRPQSENGERETPKIPSRPASAAPCVRPSREPAPHVEELKRRLLSQSHVIETLDLSRTYLGDAGLLELLPTLRSPNLPFLRKLSLRQNGLSTAYLPQLLFGVLLEKDHLTSLDLSHNKGISPRAGKDLISFARSKTTLLELHLSGTQVFSSTISVITHTLLERKAASESGMPQ